MNIKVLDKGHVRLVDKMGTDESVVQAARISYGKGTKSVQEDRGLIRYLMRHHHTTPFEMVELKFHVRCPMDCWRQWIRHRTASVNEYSTRYSEAIDDKQETEEDGWRMQSTTNKQGSGDGLMDWPEGYEITKSPDESIALWSVESPDGFISQFDHEPSPGEYLSLIEVNHHSEAQHVYDERLKFGVAKEQARKDLPLSTYTEAYWKVDLHNLFNFLRLRMDSHAQLEIREYANVIGSIVAEHYPLCWEAFVDYRLEAKAFSKQEMLVLRKYREQLTSDPWLNELSQREKSEFLAKLS